MRRLPILPRPQPSRRHAEMLGRASVRAVRVMGAAVQGIVLPALSRALPPQHRMDEEEDDQGVAGAVKRAERWAKAENTRALHGVAARAGEVVSREAAQHLRKAVEAGTGHTPPDQDHVRLHALQGFILEHAKLVGDVQDDFFARLQRRVLRTHERGERAEDLAKEIAQDFVRQEGLDQARARSRSLLIARDQLGKLYGAVTQAQQTKLGVRRYRWRTSRDERVRHSHRVREGKIFTWDEPIEDQLRAYGLPVDQIDGHPGQPIRCRCTAEPVLEDILAGLPPISRGTGGASAPPAPWPATTPERAGMGHARAARPKDAQTQPRPAAKPKGAPAPKQASIEVRPAVAGASRRVFGRKVSAQDLAALSGLSGANVSITTIGDTIEISANQGVAGGSVIASRRLLKDKEGAIYMRNVIIDIPEASRGKGTGTEIFASQVTQASRLGVKRIVADCARGSNTNGYYTWARLGYDGPLPQDLARETGLSRVRELMMTPDGRALWKARGSSFEGSFDLEAGSTSLQTLQAYMREKERG